MIEWLQGYEHIHTLGFCVSVMLSMIGTSIWMHIDEKNNAQK